MFFSLQILHDIAAVRKHSFFLVGIHRHPVQKDKIRPVSRQQLRIQVFDGVALGHAVLTAHADFKPDKYFFPFFAEHTDRLPHRFIVIQAVDRDLLFRHDRRLRIVNIGIEFPVPVKNEEGAVLVLQHFHRRL